MIQVLSFPFRLPHFVFSAAGTGAGRRCDPVRLDDPARRPWPCTGSRARAVGSLCQVPSFSCTPAAIIPVSNPRLDFAGWDRVLDRPQQRGRVWLTGSFWRWRALGRHDGVRLHRRVFKTPTQRQVKIRPLGQLLALHAQQRQSSGVDAQLLLLHVAQIGFADAIAGLHQVRGRAGCRPRVRCRS